MWGGGSVYIDPRYVILVAAAPHTNSYYAPVSFRSFLFENVIYSFQAREQNCEKWLLTSLCLSFRLSVRPPGKIRLPIIADTLHEDQYTFLIISCSVPLIIRNVSDKSCRKSQDKDFSFNTCFCNYTLYEITWKNFVEPGKAWMTTWCMRIACSITKATNTCLEYVIIIFFPLQ